MSRWDGKSKGTVFGYRIFVFFIKKAGIISAYFILYFVAGYYYLFLTKNNRSISYYFRKRLSYSWFQTQVMIYRSYYTFGQVLIDKLSIAAGMRNQFTFEFDGIAVLKGLLANKKGGVLISAHMGNFAIAEHFLGEIDVDFRVNMVVTDLEHTDIKAYLDSIGPKTSMQFIIIKEDLTHIFDINAALARNELVCFTGDRYFKEVKSLSAVFLGKMANFPAGPFRIASRLQVPVVFVYVMKEPHMHYHLYAREANVKHRDEQGLLQAYTESVASMVRKYPLQWFNYFDFWNAFDEETTKTSKL